MAMHAVAPHPTRGRRGTGGGDPNAILSLLADAGGRAPDTLGVGARRPPTPATPDPPPTPDPPSPTGRGSLATCGDVEPNPGPVTTDPGGARQQVLVPRIRGHFTLRPEPPGQTLWWCSQCGMSWRAARGTPTCPDGCAPVVGTPQRDHQSWLRLRQLVIRKRSPEYQPLRSVGLAGAGTATLRIDQPCPGREWGRRYYAWRHNLHRLAPIDHALFAPTLPKGGGPRRPAVVPHSFHVGTWRPTQAHCPRTGGRRITRWYRNWWRRRKSAWAFPQSGMPLRRRRTTASRRTERGRTTRSPNLGNKPQQAPCGRTPRSVASRRWWRSQHERDVSC